MTTASLDSATAALLGLFPALSPAEQEISVALYRLLAEGSPAMPDQVARRSGLSLEQVRAALAGWHDVYYDAAGAVIGYRGLSLRETKHRLRINGRTLHTWCAWDTLFLPEILDASCEVDSVCPVTGETIRIVLSLRQIVGAQPDGIVVSFVTPERAKIEENVVLHFCHFVHFFQSAAAGQSWVSQHPGTFVLTLDEAWQLGRRKNAVQYAARATTRDVTDR